jgi:hypothetical protein
LTVVSATVTSLPRATASRNAVSTLTRMSSVVIPAPDAAASAWSDAARMLARVWPKS